MTSAPGFNTLPTISLAAISGDRSGHLCGVDRRRYRNDEHVALAQRCRVGTEAQTGCRGEVGRFDLVGHVATTLQFGDPQRVQVVTERRKFAPKGHGERQANVTQPDHADAGIGQGQGEAHATSSGERTLRPRPMP